jgi:hypothetical protein
VEIKHEGTALHFLTRNTRFRVVEFATPHSNGFEWLVLRETFFRNQTEGSEGADTTLKVDLLYVLEPVQRQDHVDMHKKQVKWSFQEKGVGGGLDGQIVSDHVYRVTKFGCCDAPPTFAYFSLADGRRLRSSHDSLSMEELNALDESITH